MANFSSKFNFNSNFILFNNFVINTLHIRWCETVMRNCNDETGEFGIKIVVSRGSDCETFYKWFFTKLERDEEYKRLYTQLIVQ